VCQIHISDFPETCAAMDLSTGATSNEVGNKEGKSNLTTATAAAVVSQDAEASRGRRGGRGRPSGQWHGRRNSHLPLSEQKAMPSPVYNKQGETNEFTPCLPNCSERCMNGASGAQEPCMPTRNLRDPWFFKTSTKPYLDPTFRAQLEAELVEELTKKLTEKLKEELLTPLLRRVDELLAKVEEQTEQHKNNEHNVFSDDEDHDPAVLPAPQNTPSSPTLCYDTWLRHFHGTSGNVELSAPAEVKGVDNYVITVSVKSVDESQIKSWPASIDNTPKEN
jgi:hypothetical protein